MGSNVGEENVDCDSWGIVGSCVEGEFIDGFVFHGGG